MGSTARRDIFLFSHPRTASNLLCRLLSGQPGWTHSEYHFMDAVIHWRRKLGMSNLNELSDDQVKDLYNEYIVAFEKLETVREQAVTEGKNLFIKNHALLVREPASLSRFLFGGDMVPPLDILPTSDTKRTNITVFSDEYLLKWTPLFIIRHPALICESWYRAERNVETPDLLQPGYYGATSLEHPRMLYDWYLANMPSGPDGKQGTPLIVDADDIMEGSETIDKLCREIGMDASLVKYEWDQSQWHADHPPGSVHRSYLSSLYKSTSVDKSKSARNIDMDTKYKEWEGLWGKEIAEYLLSRVNSAMPDYEYLKSKKI